MARGSGAPGPPGSELGRFASAWRLVATGLGLALVFTGTVCGQDDDFPFGPFRMYSTRDSPNAPVVTTQIEATTVSGRHLTISGPGTGLRRAEVEGQLGRFVAEPALLRSLAEAYQRLHPDNPLVRVEVVRRDHPLRQGRVTGAEQTTVLASWSRP